jgi:hypothetical protein
MARLQHSVVVVPVARAWFEQAVQRESADGLDRFAGQWNDEMAGLHEKS